MRRLKCSVYNFDDFTHRPCDRVTVVTGMV